MLSLEEGQDLNQHRDYHNQPDCPDHTLNFGRFRGGHLELFSDQPRKLAIDALAAGEAALQTQIVERKSIRQEG